MYIASVIPKKAGGFSGGSGKSSGSFIGGKREGGEPEREGGKPERRDDRSAPRPNDFANKDKGAHGGKLKPAHGGKPFNRGPRPDRKYR
jgi:hypothetical protein